MMEVKCELIVTQTEGYDSFQKCYASSDLLLQLGTKTGSFVKIQHDDTTVICSIWPKLDTGRNKIQYNNAVKLGNRIGLKFDDHIGLEKCINGQVINRIKPLSVGRVQSVNVSVVLHNHQQLEKFRKNKNTWHILRHQCMNCLNRLCVSSVHPSVVNYADFECAGLYGIARIIINEVTTDNGDRSTSHDACIVRSSTTIHIDSLHSAEWYEQLSTRQEVKRPGGLESVINMLTDLVRLPIQQQQNFKKLGVDPPRGILLRGPPGCGKTSLVKYVAFTCNVYLITINGPEIIGSLPGETESNLRKLFEKAVLMGSDGPCLIFIDEIDSICAKKGKASSLQGSRVTGQLALLMDSLVSDHGVLVVAATNRPSAVDPVLRRPGRLDREVIVSPPTRKQRLDILQLHMADLPTRDDLDLDTVAMVTTGYVGADLAALCREAAYLAMAEGTSDTPVNKISQDHLKAAVKKVLPSMQKGAEGIVDLSPVHWSDIGGLEDVKRNIQQAVEWPLKHPEAFQRMGISPPKGVLLYGPPGCCKTTLVRAAATACNATFLSLSGAQLYSPYVGDSERLITEVFQKARAAPPAIIFLDEIDSIVGKRSEGKQTGVQDRVLSALLNEMDGVGVHLDDGAVTGGDQLLMEQTDISQGEVSEPSSRSSNLSVLLVAATNRPDLLDEALIRPGRVDRIVHVPHPDTEERRKILGIFTKGMTIENCDLDDIASRTEFYTGADLENLCREAALNALTENMEASVVITSHFEKALTSVRPSLNEELVQQYTSVNMRTFKKKKVS